MQSNTKTRIAAEMAVEVVHAGLCAGTTILTLDGELPVEHLSVGDRVISRTSGTAVLRDIIVTEQMMTPIRIKAGSLGHTRPDRDMIVSPDAQLHIRDWRAEALFGTPTAMVPASRLIDGEFVAEETTRVMTLFRLVFDRAQIIYADGMEIGAGV
jgi:hypothetical protein